MWGQLIDELKELWRDVRPRLAGLWARLLGGLALVWSVIRPPLLAVLQILAALIVLFEEWGWRPLVELLGRLARFKPWAMLELWIAGLPPYAALLVFALPTTTLLPLKFVAVWLLANGFVWSAGALFFAAKVASTALIARIFMLTKPALMRIGWFQRAYNWFMPWKEALFAQIRASWVWRYGRMVKTRVRLGAKQAWVRWRPRLVEQASALRALLAGATAKLRFWARAAWDAAKPWTREQAARARLAAARVWGRLWGT